MASEPTVDVASNYDEDSPSRGPEDQSEGEIIDSEGEPADPTVAGIPILDNLKMSEEEQREYDAFSLASVSVPTSSKRPWRAQGDSKVSQSQPQDISSVRQARPQAAAKAPSVKSAQSDQRSVQLQSDQRQVQLRAPQVQANFPVLAPQGQGHRQGLGRPVVARCDDLDSLFNEEEFSVDLDNEAVLKEKQARSEVCEVPSDLIISVEAVERSLLSLKVSKAVGPDRIPNWVLRDYAGILGRPIACIFNSSIRLGSLPQMWRSADVIPLPKVANPTQIEKDLRPISLTPVLSKVLERLVCTSLENTLCLH